MNCWHMSGAGNDFMVIDARGLTLDFPALARRLCQMTDADGFMAVDYSDKADFRLHFYNSDGSRGEMCGNGSRCICKFAYDNALAGESMTVETDAGLVYGQRLGENLYRVQLNNPGVIDLNRTPAAAYIELGNPGIPHGIVEVHKLSWDMLELLRHQAQALRYDPAFPKGANISFYRWLDDTSVQVLTYERGVEDYTLACGTGCASVAVTLWAKGLLPGGHLTAQCRGGTLQLTIQHSGDEITRLLLEGPAETLKTFEI